MDIHFFFRSLSSSLTSSLDCCLATNRRSIILQRGAGTLYRWRYCVPLWSKDGHGHCVPFSQYLDNSQGPALPPRPSPQMGARSLADWLPALYVISCGIPGWFCRASSGTMWEAGDGCMGESQVRARRYRTRSCPRPCPRPIRPSLPLTLARHA